MNEVVEFLQANINGVLSTVKDGKPKGRPFQFMFAAEGKYFFCTSNEKEVYQQLQVNPYVEFTSTSPKFAWIRLSGEVKFTNSLADKEQVLAASGLVKSIYQRADNPIFEVFYVEHGTAILADFSGQPPKTINF